jgi:hypothetical protein
MKRFKWHMLSLVRAIICGKNSPALNSKQIQQEAERVIEVMEQHGQRYRYFR